MILADTHVLVWLMTSNPRIPDAARDTLLSDSGVAISAVTAWEYADLQQRGRLKSGLPLAELILGLSLRIVPLPAEAWEKMEILPDIHRDPVDRMLIGHALAMDAILATADAKMRRYPVKLLW